MNDTIFVGLDVHKATVAVAVAEGMRGGEVRQMGTYPHRASDIAKLVAKLAKGGRRLSFKLRSRTLRLRSSPTTDGIGP